MSVLVMREMLVLGVFMGLGPMEMAVLGVIVLLLFGARLPSAMKSLGMSLSSFKKGMKEGEEEMNKIHDDDKDHA